MLLFWLCFFYIMWNILWFKFFFFLSFKHMGCYVFVFNDNCLAVFFPHSALSHVFLLRVWDGGQKEIMSMVSSSAIISWTKGRGFLGDLKWSKEQFYISFGNKCPRNGEKLAGCRALFDFSPACIGATVVLMIILTFLLEWKGFYAPLWFECTSSMGIVSHHRFAREADFPNS